MKAGIIAGIIVIVAAIVMWQAPLKDVPYTVMVDYEDTETYYENEPYEDTETYTETVPLDYEVVDTDIDVGGQTVTVSATVRNKDNVAGTFTVELSMVYGCTFIGPGSIEITSLLDSDEDELHLEPNDTDTATYSSDNPYPMNCALDSWSYDVTPGTKEVERERTVTKYRQVEKQRTVTKQRQETRYKKVTLLDYLLHY